MRVGSVAQAQVLNAAVLVKGCTKTRSEPVRFTSPGRVGWRFGGFGPAQRDEVQPVFSLPKRSFLSQSARHWLTTFTQRAGAAQCTNVAPMGTSDGGSALLIRVRELKIE